LHHSGKGNQVLPGISIQHAAVLKKFRNPASIEFAVPHFPYILVRSHFGVVRQFWHGVPLECSCRSFHYRSHFLDALLSRMQAAETRLSISFSYRSSITLTLPAAGNSVFCMMHWHASPAR